MVEEGGGRRGGEGEGMGGGGAGGREGGEGRGREGEEERSGSTEGLPLLNCLTSAKSRRATNSKCAGAGAWILYSRAMDERLLNELPAWLTEAGLAGASETDIVAGFAIVASQPGFRWIAPTCLSTRSIQPTRRYFARAIFQTNPHARVRPHRLRGA